MLVSYRPRDRSSLRYWCRKYTPSTRDTYPFPNPYPHVNTVTMSELIFTSSAYIIPGDSPMTSVANTVAMTTLAVHTLQPLIFYNWKMNSPERSNIQVAKAPWTLRQRWCDWWTRRRAAPRRLAYDVDAAPEARCARRRRRDRTIHWLRLDELFEPWQPLASARPYALVVQSSRAAPSTPIVEIELKWTENRTRSCQTRPLLAAQPIH